MGVGCCQGVLLEDLGEERFCLGEGEGSVLIEENDTLVQLGAHCVYFGIGRHTGVPGVRGVWGGVVVGGGVCSYFLGRKKLSWGGRGWG